MMRSRILACAAALVVAIELQAQRASPLVAPDDSTIVARWRTAKPDTAELMSLWRVTVAVGGVRPLRAALDRLTDQRSPTLVRLAALAVLPVYLDPTRVCRAPQLDTLWTPDTGCRVENASFRASSSIEPIVRDSIRARLRDAASESGLVARAAAVLVAQWATLERWSETRAAWCRRTAATFGPALRMNASALASGEFRELAQCTESGPAALALAWRDGRPDAKFGLAIVRISSRVRDRRLYTALLAVARDSTRAIDDRVAAVDAIGPLLHPALEWFTSADRRNNPLNACPSGGRGSWEAVQEEGGDPMPPATRRAGAEELVRLSRENVPPQVSEAARVVAACAVELLASRPPQSW